MDLATILAAVPEQARGVGAIELDWVDLAVATVLVLAAGVVSLAMRLGLEKRLLIASVRTVLQLLLIGYVLVWVFQPALAWTVPLVIAVMIGVASRAAVQRSARTFRGVAWLAFASLVATGLLTTATVTQVVIQPTPWYEPRYVIPLLGMILGNGLNGISLCLDQLLERLIERRAEVEMELSLGATRWEAAREPLRQAVRRGMIPIINSMMVVGLVSLPGMMTGQILAGEEPLTAVKYQIVVMFMIAAATSLGCIAIGVLVCLRLFNHRHQLRADLVRTRKE